MATTRQTTQKTTKVTTVPRLRRTMTAYAFLDEIVRLVQEEPRRLRMSWWGAIRGQAKFPNATVAAQPSCGTVGCVAGWGAILTRAHQPPPRRTTRQWYAAAHVMADLLGFKRSEYYDHGAQDARGRYLMTPEDLFCGWTRTREGTRAHVREITARIHRFQRQHKVRLQAKMVHPGESGW